MGVKYGLCNAHFAIILSTGSYDTPTRMPGAESLTLDDHTDLLISNAAGAEVPVGVKGAYKSGELAVTSLPLAFLTGLLGYKYENGILSEGKTKSDRFALLFESIDKTTPERFVFYDCIAYLPGFERITTAENIELSSDKLSIAVRRPLARLLRGYDADYKRSCLKGQQAYDNWFKEVYTA